MAVAINGMTVDPSYRNQGIGNALMKWGIGKTDSLHLESYVEATGLARHLYEKRGYRALLAVAVDMEKRDASDEWKSYVGQLGKPSMWAMWRPKNGIWKEGGPVGPWS